MRELKMVTDWPEGVPGLQASAVRLAETIGVASGGRLRIEVFPAGKFVKAFETFDAVEAGVAVKSLSGTSNTGSFRSA